MKCQHRLVCMLLALLILMTGCSGQESAGGGGTSPSGADDSAQALTPAEIEAKENFANSTPEKDTDTGLKNIKIDTAEMSLTDEQKAVLSFFDDDYLSVPSYEFLRRYPNVFDGAQITLWGSVKKVISMDANSYELVLWLGIGPAEWEYSYEYPEYEGAYVLLTGKTGSAWFMEGDTLKIYGRYAGIETVEVDGTSYTIPKVSAYSELFDTSQAPNDIERFIERYSANDVKTVAKAIFGNNIEVRRPIVGTDVTEEVSQIWYEVYDGFPCYVVELENQSNAKFTKYFFNTNSDVYQRIEDAKDSMSWSPVSRNLEFAADFQHFFLFTYNQDLESLDLEYYDHDLNKIWEREFEETTTALYDYTKNNIYLLANNELYIINTQTGEDTFPPSYVGEKQEIRKLPDGILMISENKSDGVMKVSLDGSIIWKTNLPEDVYVVSGLQLVGNHIVFDEYYWSSFEDYGTHYLVIDNESGDILVDAVSIGYYVGN